MKPTDRNLQRLLDAAAKAAPEAPRRRRWASKPGCWPNGARRARTTNPFPCSRSSAARCSAPASCWCCAPPGAYPVRRQRDRRRSGPARLRHPDEPQPMTSLGKRKLGAVCAGHLPGGRRQRRARRVAGVPAHAGRTLPRRRSARGCAPDSSPSSTLTPDQAQKDGPDD